MSLGIDWGDDARLASRRLYRTADGTNLSLLSYAYDNDDNITAITDGVTPVNDVAYAYDVRGRLSQVSLAPSSAAPFKRTDYAHDAIGKPAVPSKLHDLTPIARGAVGMFELGHRVW